MLSELQKDAFQEYMNVGIGKAGELLSQLVQSRIDLTVPYIELLSMRDNKHKIVEVCLADQSDGQVISTSLHFGQQFHGRAHLLFPMSKVHRLLDYFIGDELPEVQEQPRFSETHLDIMREIGNVVLNAVLGSIGNLLELRLEYQVPDVEFFNLHELEVAVEANETYLVIIQTSFHVRDSNITGAILILLSLDSITLLVEKITELLENFDG